MRLPSTWRNPVSVSMTAMRSAASPGDVRSIIVRRSLDGLSDVAQATHRTDSQVIYTLFADV